jgi:hypothetical protein
MRQSDVLRRRWGRACARGDVAQKSEQPGVDLVAPFELRPVADARQGHDRAKLGDGVTKVHCLRALIRSSAVPCLYVMSLTAKYRTEEANIESVFQRAREVSPCCLVFEDLDGMIHDGNGSFFLNQLDGIGDVSGLLTIATTNHPERLDPAIADRPSRFDRKYHFGLPNVVERASYIASWNDRVAAEMRIDGSELGALVPQTDGFSFAYLRELYVSSMTRWMVAQKVGTMGGILVDQLVTLRSQMRGGASAMFSAPVAQHAEHDDDD